VRLQGHSKFLLKRKTVRTKWSKIIAAHGSVGFAGNGHERKEAFLLKAFLDTFVATKVSGPPAAKSGYTPGKTAL